MDMRCRQSLFALVTSGTIAVGGLQAASAPPLHTRLQMAAVVHRAPVVRPVWAGHPWPPGEPARFVSATYTADTMCIFMTPHDRPVPGSYGWKFEVTLLSETADHVTVKAAWHQAAPVEATGPEPSRQITLSPGDAVVLDRIEAGPVPAGRVCSATAMTLELRLCGGVNDPCGAMP